MLPVFLASGWKNLPEQLHQAELEAEAQHSNGPVHGVKGCKSLYKHHKQIRQIRLVHTQGNPKMGNPTAGRTSGLGG